jgi:hypothetical protein
MSLMAIAAGLAYSHWISRFVVPCCISIKMQVAFVNARLVQRGFMKTLLSLDHSPFLKRILHFDMIFDWASSIWDRSEELITLQDIMAGLSY